MSEDNEKEIIEDLSVAADRSEPEELVTIGKSWDDLEAEMKDGDESVEEEGVLPKPPVKNFWLSKNEIAEFAYDASFGFRCLVESFEEAGEEIIAFPELPQAEQDEWGEIAGAALRMQSDTNPENWARVVHAKISMGLLKTGVTFSEKFTNGGGFEPQTSPLVAPWECLPLQYRAPLLIFKNVCSALYMVWDKENENLLRS